MSRYHSPQEFVALKKEAARWKQAYDELCEQSDRVVMEEREFKKLYHDQLETAKAEIERLRDINRMQVWQRNEGLARIVQERDAELAASPPTPQEDGKCW